MSLSANICLLMRYEMGLPENVATMYFHMIELMSYLTAFVAGQFALYSMKPILVLALLMEIAAFALTILGFMHAGKSTDRTSILGISVIGYHESTFYFAVCTVFYAFAHGLNLIGILKLVQIKMTRRSTRYVVGITSIFQLTANIWMPFIFYRSEISAIAYYFLGALFVFLVLTFSLHLMIMIVFWSTDFQLGPYPPWLHWSVLFCRLFLPARHFFLLKVDVKKIEIQKLRLLIADIKKKIRRNLPLTPEEKTLQLHWLDPVSALYPSRFIAEMKMKLNYTLIMISFPGIFIAFEVPYSYWVYSAYRTDRLVERQHINTQIVFSVYLVVFMASIFLYCFFVGPFFRRIWFDTPLRRMTLGTVFIMLSLLLGLITINHQALLNIKSNEPYFGQTKFTIRNALTCELTFQKYLINLKQLQSEANSSIILRDGVKSVRNFTKRKINDTWMDELSGNESLYGLTFPKSQPFKLYNSLNLYPSTKWKQSERNVQKWDSVNVMTPFNNCSTIVYYNIIFSDTMLDFKDTAQMALLIIEPTRVRRILVPSLRPRSTTPGMRFIFCNRSIVNLFEIWLNENLVRSFRKLNGLTTDYIHFMEGDDGIWFRVDQAKFHLNFKLKDGGLYDMMFIDVQGKIAMLKVFVAESPHETSIIFCMVLFGFIAMGEFLFGVLGLRFIMSQTPFNLRHQTLCDWYLMYAIANAIIIIILRCGQFVTVYSQVAALCYICLVSIFLFFLFSAQYYYRFASDMKMEQKINNIVF